jgi:esterase/lipase
MKRIAAYLLLVAGLTASTAAAAMPERRNIGENQIEAKRAAKQYKKYQNKQAKRQRKQMKKYQKAQQQAARHQQRQYRRHR